MGCLYDVPDGQEYPIGTVVRYTSGVSYHANEQRTRVSATRWENPITNEHRRHDSMIGFLHRGEAVVVSRPGGRI